MAEALPMPGGSALPQPRLGRLALAFLVGPAVGTAAFLGVFVLTEAHNNNLGAISSSMWFDLELFATVGVVGYMFALGTTIIMGGPLYFLLRQRMRFTLGHTAALGGGVALVLVVYLMTIGAAPPPAFDDPLGSPFLFTACGALGGLAFWLCAFWRDPRFSHAARP